MVACGGLITAEKLSIPYIPRLDTVNVPPDSSPGEIDPFRTRSARARALRAISPRDSRSASNTVGTTRASLAATAMPTLIRSYVSTLPSR